jgi:hypothetical protein
VPRGEVRRAGQSGPDVMALRSWCALRSDFGAGAKVKRLVRWAQAVTGRVAATLILGENRCNRSSAGVPSTAGVAADVPGGLHLGKIGQLSRQPLPRPPRTWPPGCGSPWTSGPAGGAELLCCCEDSRRAVFYPERQGPPERRARGIAKLFLFGGRIWKRTRQARQRQSGGARGPTAPRLSRPHEAVGPPQSLRGVRA